MTTQPVEAPPLEWLVPSGTYQAHLWDRDIRGVLSMSYCRRWVGRWSTSEPRQGVSVCDRCATEARRRGEPLPPWTVSTTP